MITFFTSCKPFIGEDAMAQKNAISSWKQLHPELEIIIFGDDQGAKECAEELDVRHVPEIERSEFGNPFVSDLFEKVQQIAKNDICCYINADIILLDDFIPAVTKVALSKGEFLLVGKRYDLDVKFRLEFDREWQNSLRKRVLAEGSLYHLPGMDYFVFRKGQWEKILPFVLGNVRWDNWMVYEARRVGIPIVDGTGAITAVHQNHEIKHAEQSDEGGYDSDPAAKYNLELYGRDLAAFFHLDATHVLDRKGLRLAKSLPYLQRRLITTPVFYPGTSLLCRTLNWVLTRVRAVWFS